MEPCARATEGLRCGQQSVGRETATCRAVPAGMLTSRCDRVGGAQAVAEGRLFHHHDIRPPAVTAADAAIPTDLDEYLFDLKGFLLLPGVLSAQEVAEGNALIDTIPRDLPRGGWHGWVQREDH